MYMFVNLVIIKLKKTKKEEKQLESTKDILGNEKRQNFHQQNTPYHPFNSINCQSLMLQIISINFIKLPYHFPIGDNIYYALCGPSVSEPMCGISIKQSESQGSIKFARTCWGHNLIGALTRPPACWPVRSALSLCITYYSPLADEKSIKVGSEWERERALVNYRNVQASKTRTNSPPPRPQPPHSAEMLLIIEGCKF